MRLRQRLPSRQRLILASCIAVLSCNGATDEVPPANPDGGSGGGVIVIAPDSGFRPPSFACDTGTPDQDAPPPQQPSDGGRCAASNVSVGFQGDVLPVIQGCSGEACHAPWSYATTVNVVSTECCDHRRIIDPGNPERSYLLQKIRGIDLCGNSSKMGNVSPEVAQKIEDWICLGALNN